MRIAILTQPLRYNYGGLLQNYALQTVLKRMGHKPVTLDPNPYALTDWTTPFRVIKRTIWKYVFHKQRVGIIWEYRKNHNIKLLETNTGQFIKKHIHYKRYRDIDNVKIKIYDAIIVGSDQVWRPRFNGNRQSNMFLDFAVDLPIKKIAYAASFGTEDWEFSEEQTSAFSKYISHFDGISVREDSGVTLCQNHLGVNAIHVLDPTMLLSKEDYILDIIPEQKNEGGNRLFYYILDESEEKQKIVERYAKILHLTPFTSNKNVNGRLSKDINKSIQPPVENWISAFNDADFVVTDSFHGSVFSILFNKPFVTILNEGRGNARIKSLLSMFHLEDRVYCNSNDTTKPINWDSVNAILQDKREAAFQFLKENLH